MKIFALNQNFVTVGGFRLRQRSISAAVRLTVRFNAPQRCYSCTSAFIQIIKLYAIANKMS